MITMGQLGRDKITLFKGIITARHQYITGCDQYTLSPEGLDKEGKLHEQYQFDEGRIDIIGAGINEKKVQTKTKGGPQRTSTAVK